MNIVELFAGSRSIGKVAKTQLRERRTKYGTFYIYPKTIF